MKKSEIEIIVKLGDILNSGWWNEFCDKYSINEWCINEGLADMDTDQILFLDDAEKYGLISE